MYVRNDEVGDQRNLNVAWVANYWINNGCSREKLMLGLGTYGRAFRLVNANNNGLGAPTSSLPTAGTVCRIIYLIFLMIISNFFFLLYKSVDS